MRSWIAYQKIRRLMRIPAQSDEVVDHRILAHDGLPLQDEDGFDIKDEDADA
jgi:hypothetical protein